MKHARMLTLAFFSVLILLFPHLLLAASPLDTLKPGEWLEIPNSHLRALDPCPARNCPYTLTSGVTSVMDAWSGGAYDTTEDRLIVTGGGHSDYAGNELYAFSLATLSWSRLTEPTLAVGNLTTCHEALDGTPASRHTYNGLQYLPASHELWLYGGALANTSGTCGSSFLLWRFDLTTRMWRSEDASSGTAPNPSYGIYSAVDPTTGFVWAHGTNNYTRAFLGRYDPTSKGWWQSGNPYDKTQYNATAAIDPIHHQLVAVGFRRGTDEGLAGTQVFNLTQGWIRSVAPATTGDTALEDAIAPGFVWDSGSQQFVGWNGGADVYTLDPVTWVWTRRVPAATNTAVPGPPNRSGTYGRFRYIPSQNLFVVVNTVDTNVFLYRLSTTVAPPEPPRPPLGKIDGVWPVCPTCALRTAPEAAAIVQDGDVVVFAPGTYTAGAVWTKHNLTLRGTPGTPRPIMQGGAVQGKAIWLLTGNNTTLEHLAFTGATVSDGNGAGVKLEGKSLTIRDCLFADNQNGLLTGGVPGVGRGSTILIESSEFARNGFGDPGRNHNIYIAEGDTFTLQYSWSHGAQHGHLVKSRAWVNTILYNRLTDDPGGNASLELDFSNGGVNTVIGNLIRQDAQTENSTLLGHGMEGPADLPAHSLTVVHNTFVNDRYACTFLQVNAAGVVPLIANNLFVGTGCQPLALNGVNTPLAPSNTFTLTPAFVDAAAQDYHPTAATPGVDRGELLAAPLVPQWEYVHPLDKRARVMRGPQSDAGAYEFGAALPPPPPPPPVPQDTPALTVQRKWSDGTWRSCEAQGAGAQAALAWIQAIKAPAGLEIDTKGVPSSARSVQTGQRLTGTWDTQTTWSCFATGKSASNVLKFPTR